jgi:hypothetical protein
VYLPRFPFLIVVSLSLLKQLAKGYVLRGQGHGTPGAIPNLSPLVALTPPFQIGAPIVLSGHLHTKSAGHDTAQKFVL